jgi:D-alanine-D-alanine ligase
LGFHKVDTEEEYETAMKDAFTYDYKVLVEAGIKNPREIEISILGTKIRLPLS